MNNILYEAVCLHSKLQETGTIKQQDDYTKLRQGIYSLMISLYRSSLEEDKYIRTGHLFSSLVHLDQLEFELKSLDLPEGWKDMDFIFREINGLRRSIYAMIIADEN